MERLYLKIVGTHISIYHRATHALIDFLPSIESKEGAERFLELLRMPLNDFYKFIAMYRNIKPNQYAIDNISKDDEYNYKSAWKKGTDKYLELHGITNIADEEVPFDYIKEVTRKYPTRWDMSVQRLELPVVKETPKQEIKAPKKLIKKKVQLTPLEELELKFKDGALTIREYRMQKRKLLMS